MNEPTKISRKQVQLMALFFIELMIFIPFAVVEGLQVSHDPNPAKDITSSSAVIKWTTDVEANARVDYGKSKQLGLEKTIADLDTVHEVLLENLTPNTRYYLQLMSIAVTGDYLLDDNSGQFYSFVTKTEGDIVAPEISNISIVALTATTATIRWNTNEASDSTVHAAEDGQPLSRVKHTSDMVRTHVITIPSSEGIKYNYIVGSCDNAGNCRNSTQQFFVGGADMDPPEINVEIPEWHNSGRIDIEGTTEPYSKVIMYINGERARMLQAHQTGDTGTVTFKNVAIPLPENNITITAIDQVGNEASRDYVVKIDPMPPTLKVTGLPGLTNEMSAQVTIEVDEPCTIFFDVGTIDEVPPKKVSGLEASRVSTEMVELEWDDVNVSDFYEYGVYRWEIKPQTAPQWELIIATPETRFQDTNVKSGSNYSYRVSAVDKKCNEGQFSDSIVAEVPMGGSQATSIQIQAPGFSCTTLESRQHDGGTFQHTLTFEEGVNRVEIIAMDRAGHQVIYRNETIYDSSPPVILKNNINQLSPTYIPTVTVRGNVSEQASVIVSVNEQLAASGDTASDGSFEINVDLGEGRVATPSELAAASAHLPVLSALLEGDLPSAGTTPMYINDVKLIAVDTVGSESEPVEGQVIYTTCGLGNWFRVDIAGRPGSVFGVGGLSPAILNPRLMLEGLEVISFPVNISYKGQYNASIDQVSISKDPINIALAEGYDEEWASNPSIVCNNERTICLVQMTVNVPDPTPTGENWTTFQKEQNISNNRKDDCLVPATGCMKLPMLLEIAFREIKPARTGPAYEIAGTAGQPQIEQKIQKVCWDLEIGIDQRVDPDILPEGLLTIMIDFFNASIEAIDAILEPLENIRLYVFYACALMWVVQFFSQFSYNSRCRTIGSGSSSSSSSTTSVATDLIGAATGTSFNVNYAKMGICELAYPESSGSDSSGSGGSTSESARELCKSCEDAIKTKASTDHSMRMFCDRLFCPSAPTLQKYVKSKSASAPKKVTVKEIDKTLYLGNSCACRLGEGDKDECVPVKSGQSGFSTSYETMKRVYEWYKQEQQNEKNYEDAQKGIEGCKGPHTAKAKCCGYEYMYEWGTACGAGSDEAIFSEIKESLCLAGQNTNQPSTISSLNLGGEGTGSVQCHRTFNSVAGFCEDSGNVSVEPYPVGTLSAAKAGALSPTVDTSDRRLFACMTPPTGESTKYSIKFCYATTQARVTDTADASTSGGWMPFRRESGFYSPPDKPDWDVSSLFEGVGDEAAENRGRSQFCSRLASITGDRSKAGECTEYNKIRDLIGDPNKDYIVEPTANIIRSFQCLCISGIIANLMLWKRASEALMNCFNTLLITGDGSAGICEAAVSTYICDFIYEIIKCTSSSYSQRHTRQSSDSYGGTLSALTNAGSSVSDSVGSRYGDSPLWETMFVENRVMHAVCLWVFTGTWDLDMESLIGGNESLPVTESLATIISCDRRFKSYNPISVPEGLSTWIYHFAVGIIPGADLTYSVKLVCDEGYECDESEGFERGRCDCRNGKQELTVADPKLTGTLSRSGTLNEEIFFNLENTGLRYNRIVLEWTYEDNNGQMTTKSEECEVSQSMASPPPAFCNFDVGNAVFRCSLGITTQEWARINKVEAQPPGLQTAFKLGDDIKFLVDVQQAVPANPTCTGGSCSYTKYLTGKITNPAGGVVWEKSAEPLGSGGTAASAGGALALNTAGQSLYTDFVNFKISDTDDFNRRVGTTTGIASSECMQGTHSSVSIDKCQPTDCSFGCSQYSLGFSGTPTVARSYVFATNRSHYMVFRLKEVDNSNPTFVLDTAKQKLSTETTWYKHHENQEGLNINPVRLDDSHRQASLPNGIKINVFGNPAVAYNEILINVRPSAAQVTGAEACGLYDTLERAKKRNPWTAEFTLYDSRQIGGRYEIDKSAVTVHDGKPQVFKVPFYVVCSNTISVSGTSDTKNCDPRSTQPQPGCWCDPKVQQEAAASPSAAANTPFDCGAGTGKGDYCVDGTCGSLPACEKDPTKVAQVDCICSVENNPCKAGIEACHADGTCNFPLCPLDERTVPVSFDCGCTVSDSGLGVCKKDKGEVCAADTARKSKVPEFSDELYSVPFTGCLKAPVCNTSTKEKGVELTYTIFQKTGYCFCVGPQGTYNECGGDKGKYCCAAVGTCVNDYKQCLEKFAPTIEYELRLDGKKVEKINELETKTYKLFVKADWTAATVLMSIESPDKPEWAMAPTTKESSDNFVELRDITFEPDDAGKSFKLKIIAADTQDTSRKGEKEITLTAKGVAGKPIVDVKQILLTRPNLDAAAVVPSAGTYMLRKGADYVAALDLKFFEQEEGDEFYVDVIGVPGMNNLEGQLSHQEGTLYGFVFKAPAELPSGTSQPAKFVFNIKSKQTQLTDSKTINVKGFTPVEITSFSINNNPVEAVSLDLLSTSTVKADVTFKQPEAGGLPPKGLTLNIGTEKLDVPISSCSVSNGVYSCSKTFTADTKFDGKNALWAVEQQDGIKSVSRLVRLNVVGAELPAGGGPVFACITTDEKLLVPRAATPTFTVVVPDRDEATYQCERALSPQEFAAYDYNLQVDAGLSWTKDVWDHPQEPSILFTITKERDPTGNKDYNLRIIVTDKITGQTVGDGRPFIFEGPGAKRIYLEVAASGQETECWSEDYPTLWVEGDEEGQFHETCLYLTSDETSLHGQNAIRLYVKDSWYDPALGVVYRDGRFNFGRWQAEDDGWGERSQSKLDKIVRACKELKGARIIYETTQYNYATAIPTVFVEESSVNDKSFLATVAEGRSSAKYYFYVTDNFGAYDTWCDSDKFGVGGKPTTIETIS